MAYNRRMDREKLRLWAPPAAWMGAIFVLSSIPGGAVGPEWISIAGHIVEYGLLSALLWRALAGSTRLPAAGLAALATVTAFLYGMSDEWHQSFVPRRTPDPFDLLVDLAAAAAVAIVLTAVARKR